MQVTLSKKDVQDLMMLVNRENCRLGRLIETAEPFEKRYQLKVRAERRKLWAKLFDAQMRGMR